MGAQQGELLVGGRALDDRDHGRMKVGHGGKGTGLPRVLRHVGGMLEDRSQGIDEGRPVKAIQRAEREGERHARTVADLPECGKGNWFRVRFWG